MSLYAQAQRPSDGHARLVRWSELEQRLSSLQTDLDAIQRTAECSPWVDRCYLAIRRRLTLVAIERTKASMRDALRS